MFCSKCGKTIDDNAPFCGFCGTPTGKGSETVTNGAPQAAVPQPTAPQTVAPQPVAPQAPQYGAPQAPQYGAPQAPQYGAPQAPQYGTPQAPQYGAPQQAPMGGKPTLNLAPNVVDLINKVLRGCLAVLAILIFIGAIGVLASLGSMKSMTTSLGSTTAALNAVQGLIAFSNLARVPAIISFALALGGAVFTYLTKQRSLFSYIAAGAGVLMFVFNFFLAKFSSIVAMLSITEGTYAASIVGSIFLLISAVVMIVCSLVIILKKENIINYNPNF